ncbi:hypothetical protein B0J14DRAFT_658774 [Halenospora varia]|nr:hypothetical protein B0J14DRAFT_658774 [Halenospora varia]
MDNLSTELRIEIAEWVGSEEKVPAPGNPKRPSLLELAQCSRIWNQAVQHVLSRSPTLVQIGKSAGPAMLKRFMVHPEHATPIKKFICTDIGFNPIDMSQYSQVHFLACEACIHAIGVPAEDTIFWTSALRLGECDAVTCVILSFLHNIEELDVTTQDSPFPLGQSTDVFLRRVAQLQCQEPSKISLQHLNTVAVRCSTEPGTSLGFDAVMPYILPPSVTNLTIDGLTDSRGTPQDFICMVKSLKLLKCKVGSALLPEFLGHFPALETFHYEHGKRTFTDYVFGRYLMASIGHLKHSLRELVVLNRFQWSPSLHLFGGPPSQMVDFADYQNLQNLTVFASLLFDSSSHGSII